MVDKWGGDGRRAVMQSLAEDAAGQGRHFLYIRIPGDIGPIERGERFEDALSDVLEKAGLGEVTGGGSQLGAGNSVEYCGIDLVVSDRESAIPVIRNVLQAHGCPRDAVIEEYLPQYQESTVWMDGPL